MTPVNDLSDFVAGAAKRVGPAVIGLGRGWGRGSGVVIGKGEVLTNAHNLRHDEVTVAFAGGRHATGRVAGTDADLDLAVVAVDTGNAPAIAWEPDEAGPSIGTPLVALANPGGRGLRATLGLVSSGRRAFRGPRGRLVEDVIEHTAPLPPGSSGGPLVDGRGRLIGVNTLRLDGGLIIAVMATSGVRERVKLLARGEAAGPHRLGVAVLAPRAARRMRRAVGLPERDGLLIRTVEAGSPAARAGMEPGDLIVDVAGEPLDGIDALYAALDALPATGGSLALTVVRGSDEREVVVELGRR